MIRKIFHNLLSILTSEFQHGSFLEIHIRMLMETGELYCNNNYMHSSFNHYGENFWRQMLCLFFCLHNTVEQENSIFHSNSPCPAIVRPHWPPDLPQFTKSHTVATHHTYIHTTSSYPGHHSTYKCFFTTLRSIVRVTSVELHRINF